MNNVDLIGRLTDKPEISYTQSQKAVGRFTLAVNRPRRNGEDQGADFIRVITWERLAENCSRFLDKGSKCAVSGRIQTGSYKDRDGKTVYTTDVVAANVEFLDGNKSSNKETNEAPQVSIDASDLPNSFSAAEDDIPF